MNDNNSKPVSGIEEARKLGGALHCDVLEAMKEQLLIAFVLRMGGDITMHASEIDATGDYNLAFAVDPVTKVFRFITPRKA